ncbi:MAG TPA: phage tail family protein [Candidatus Saccharibacteria bacterium]|nr:phage tail family protein [Candidatus Saccharibacteria bacterium]
MIHSITATNPQGESLKMELARPEGSGLIIRKVDGLGPVKATVNLTSVVGLDVSTVNSTSLDPRNIVFDIELMAQPTIEVTRRISYNFFQLRKLVKLEVVTDTITFTTEGIVESNEPDIFSQNESVAISIICGNPYLIGTQWISEDFSSVIAKFEFEWENGLGLNELELSTRSTSNARVFENIGDPDVGVVFKLKFTGPVTSPRIVKMIGGDALKIDSEKLITIADGDIVAGDEIHLSTIVGDRYARLYRTGATINILGAIDPTSNWLQLPKGKTELKLEANSGVNNIQMLADYPVYYNGV